MATKATLSLFLENNRTSSKREAAYVYDKPTEIISITKADDLKDGIASIKDALARGYHVAGWISYEAGLCFEGKLSPLVPEKSGVPFIHMGVYETRKVLDTRSADNYWQGFEDSSAYELSNLRMSQDKESYEKSFNRIQDYLKAGDIYQVNYTQKALFDFKGSTKSLYAALRGAQAVEYAAYIESDALTVLSLSPELFIRKKGQTLIVKPMKGTCRRGRTPAEDQICADTLYNSDKERAENLMIVDLLRNDLSKLAERGSVNVNQLYEVEKYRTLFTMTSTIQAEVSAGKSAVEVMTSIFPCGSVTGAPKIRAQEIIDELEGAERGIYTGAIGYFTPDGDMCFSVPIRTATIDHSGRGELGIGGAIVADSQATSEYDESLLKAEFLTKEYPVFDLIESFLWTANGGYRSLDSHMERLEKSAQYFSFVFDRSSAESMLELHAKYISDQMCKVRMLLSKRGTISITSEKIEPPGNETDKTVIVSNVATNSNDPLYFHKTTFRDHYTTEFKKYKAERGCFEVLFTNERGELTEGSFTNILLEKNGIYYTPPTECGLLPGIYRQKLLTDDALIVNEKVIYPKDLKDADRLYVCNSVRGLVPVYLLSN
tara:strand:- start:174486 stop:176294 length:1809 start_codon:yes stop_codon:yes gene_type:complete